MATMTNDEKTSSHDLNSLLGSDERDFLIRQNNDQVKISSLIGKTVGIYFSAAWCGPCRRFTPKLVQAYQELSEKSDFEVVFISFDKDEEAFSGYFGKMPWLALPFSDLGTRKRLERLFKLRVIPFLVILGKDGVSNDAGVEIISDYGAEGYPFTSERLDQLKEETEKTKREQSLMSLLVNVPRDYLLSNDANKVPVNELEGKTVGLYFSENSHKGCLEFTKVLIEVYKKLRDRGENFEVVLVSLDEEEQDFRANFGTMPWLSLPFKDQNCEKLSRYFQIRDLPALVVMGPDGKTQHPNAVESIEEHGDEAYPFMPEECAKLGKAKAESQTLESILVHEDKDFVIAKDGSKVKVTELVGKTILLYFSAEWCPPCRDFLPKFISVYEEIKAKDDAFEVIYISSDRNQLSFDDYFYAMPWLALPFNDERKAFLHRSFRIKGIPAVVAIGPDGRTVNTHVRQLIQAYGAEAYPFNTDRVKQLEEKVEEMAKGWPKKVKHELDHKHNLILTRRSGYKCDGCQDMGYGWSYSCDDCNLDLHPKCALKKEIWKPEKHSKDGYVCDGDVCRKA
ncbi:OLC1v1028289C1 [Oldenlandia corymbosa var. corymbosa]|uniref:protein-disulfide reductase n=1 Tax=Oldenlandia corymbosa var. corymbosa TaxID=529605 RepID=A0AAV1CBD2_OLDCO|nr:OLC1v1028289C1 [Oldenlandia corymbosa var. corymbosa]